MHRRRCTVNTFAKGRIAHRECWSVWCRCHEEFTTCMLSFPPVMVCLHAEMSSLSGHSWSPSENSMSARSNGGRHHNSGMPALNNHLHGVRSKFCQAFVICVSPPSCCLILAEMILRCAKPHSFESHFAAHFLSCCQC